MGRAQLSILVVGTAVAIALLMFPEWFAVHPIDPNLSQSIGYGWLLSPPPPPQGFETMRVEHGRLGFWLAGVVATLTAVLWWASRPPSD